MRHNNQHLRIVNKFPPNPLADMIIRRARRNREYDQQTARHRFYHEQCGRVIAKIGK